MKNFLREILATIVGVSLVACFLLFLFLFAVAVGVQPVRHKGVLTVDLSQPISDRGAVVSPFSLLQGDDHAHVALHDAVLALREAARDDDITAVFLHGGVSGDLPLLRELRSAMLELREKEKPIVAYFGDYDEKTYYLASLADEVCIAPLGILALDGFSAQVLYFGDAFKKVGIEVQVSRAGKYKSAVEPYVMGEMSRENREQLQALLGDLNDVMLEDVADVRATTVDELRAIMQGGGYLTAQEALQHKLVDRVASFDQVLDRIREITDTDPDETTFEQVTLESYAEHVASKHRRDRHAHKIAVVFAEGEIVDGSNTEMVGGDTVARELRAHRIDDDVKAVVLRVNSPGGSASASDVILSEVRRLREADKIVVVSMAHVAASGGYWISSLADAIVAQPNTITGSIGVFGMFPNGEELLRDIGLHNEVVKTGPNADLFSIYRRKSPRELELVQRQVDLIYDGFLDRVTEGRRMKRDEVHEIAQGRVWSGREALRLGLVDQLGGLEEAIELAADKAGLGDDFGVLYPTVEETKLDILLELLGEGEDGEPLAAAMQWPAELRDAVLNVARLTRRSVVQGIYARLPYELSVR